jgi:hypothetical protein
MLGEDCKIEEKENITTFVDLYNFLKEYDNKTIMDWLNNRWEGKDKQESLLRLFAGLGLIEKLNKYSVCGRNFNLGEIVKHRTYNDIFFDEKKRAIRLNDSGNASDLTCVSKTNNKHILLTTSKNLKKYNVGSLDIDKILTNFRPYEENDYKMSLCICIRDIKIYNEMKERTHKTSEQLNIYLRKEDTIVIDWKDLEQAYCKFKDIFKMELSDIINSNKMVMKPKMHQELGAVKTLRMKNEGKTKILWGHIQRSGKSYIMCNTIIKDSIDKRQCNYLVITTAPNETIEQQLNVFDCLQLSDFNVVLLNGDNKTPILSEKNIILCSIHFLKLKINKSNMIKWLSNMNFDMIFMDESHYGGTTDKAKKVMDIYVKNVFTVFVTATYSKPSSDYNIPENSWILWDLEDIKLCQNIEKKESIDKLTEKHGTEFGDIICKYTKESIINEYSKYPELYVLTDELKSDVEMDIIERTRYNDYGWSIKSCFLLKEEYKRENKEKIVYSEFQNDDENLKVWYKIFGKRNKYGIPDDKYPDSTVFMKRIEKICKNGNNLSRFIGEGDFKEEPMIIMAFLPQTNINKTSIATKNLLEKHKVIPEYIIVNINCEETTNPKKTIETARNRARSEGKKGVLVLSGRQCSLGVSINNCDIVLLLNNNSSFDMLYQMMFRCMTEGKNKKCGFVIDMNIHRFINKVLVKYAMTVKPTAHPRKAVKYMLQERLINLNADHWMSSYGYNDTEIDTLCKSIYDIYSSDTENALEQLLRRLKFKEVLLSQDEQKIFNTLFSNTKTTKEQKEVINKLITEDDVKEGIEKMVVQDDNDNDGISKDDNDGISKDDNNIISEDGNDIKEDKINYIDVLRHMIPLISLLTIHNNETTLIEMFRIINDDEYKLNILINQTKSWWGKNIDIRTLYIFINVYKKYMMDDNETMRIIRTVKELYMKNIRNSRELSKIIDKYLIPQELEKKTNAEVSTPYKLRRRMLSKIPKKFWKKIRKVFEPCSGKCGFLLDIIDMFMEGLKKKYPNEKKRYKIIVTKCLYFSDINPTNIFICRLLLDPYGEYDLNFNEGNTLELDITEKWGIDSFDAVIGNPPYNNSSGTGGSRKLWDTFVISSINKWIVENGYLLFIHPPNWRKPENRILDLIKKYNLISLNILDEKEGIKYFNCSTKADYYLLRKCKYENTTFVNNKIKINIQNMQFIPNRDFNIFDKIKGVNDIVCSNTSYSSDMKWMKDDNKLEYKYILTKNSKITKYKYSSEQKNYNGIKKVIISLGRYPYPINDYKGEYGLSCYNFGIVIDNKKEGDNIINCINSELFSNLLKNNKWGSYNIEWRMFKYFKKDFWKDFVDDNKNDSCIENVISESNESDTDTSTAKIRKVKKKTQKMRKVVKKKKS